MRTRSFATQTILVVGGVGLACLIAGCGGSNASERLTPSIKSAQQALTSALTAWQNGQPPGLVAGAKPRLQVVDSHRKPAQTLARFEILGEVPGDAARTLAVRLTLRNPDEETRARFVVVGVDPIWVFRHEDYEMMTHWEHPMPAESKDKQPPGTKQ